MIIKLFKILRAILCPKYRRVEVHKPRKIKQIEELKEELNLNYDRSFFRRWNH